MNIRRIVREEIFKKNMDAEEKIRINNINLEKAINNNDITEIYTAKVNIAFLQEDLEEIEDILIDIHNYEKSKMIEKNKLISTEILKDLCRLKEKIYKELEEKFPHYLEEDYDYAY